MVPGIGLEPIRTLNGPPDFKSDASANSATPACLFLLLVATDYRSTISIVSINKVFVKEFFVIFSHFLVNQKIT